MWPEVIRETAWSSQGTSVHSVKAMEALWVPDLGEYVGCKWKIEANRQRIFLLEKLIIRCLKVLCLSWKKQGSLMWVEEASVLKNSRVLPRKSSWGWCVVFNHVALNCFCGCQDQWHCGTKYYFRKLEFQWPCSVLTYNSGTLVQSEGPLWPGLGVCLFVCRTDETLIHSLRSGFWS